MARSSRLSACFETESRNSSRSHPPRSTGRRRTTPWIAGVGPAPIAAASAARCASVGRGGRPGALRSTRPGGPAALNRITQSRTTCGVTPPSRAASLRVAPSWIAADAGKRRDRAASFERRAKARSAGAS
jgi:hypothetical protein